jgi:mono/diheme cytochrome c family protein
MAGRVASRGTGVAIAAAGALAVVLGGAACQKASGYLTDRTFRRAALLASLVTTENDYATLRLYHYASGDADDWEKRPEWNPPVAPLTVGGAKASALAAGACPLPISKAAQAGEPAALRSLGEAAFFRYPTQLVPYAEPWVKSPAQFSRYGFWLDAGKVGGLLRVALADGSVGVAVSCATCHARVERGQLYVGLGNDRLDLGALIHDEGRSYGAELRQAAQSWGAGRVDVSTDSGVEPARIPDLRPVRFLTHLQQAGAVRQLDLNSLAVRIETLIITAHGGAVRPPRPISLGLAAYVWSLADKLPLRPPTTDAEHRGAALFAARCQSCHLPPGYAGPPVPQSEVGTAPELARSAIRGTGGYRVPSLRGVSTRGALLHDGTLPDAAALLDPGRLLPGWKGLHEAGPVSGHTYGLELSPAARADLLAFLNCL